MGVFAFPAVAIVDSIPVRGVKHQRSMRRWGRLVEQCLRNPQWQIPADLYKYLPAALTEIVSKQETIEGVARYKYSVRSRTVATRLLLQMHGQNQAEKPPPQEVNVNVRSDVATEIDQLGQLSDEQLAN